MGSTITGTMRSLRNEIGYDHLTLLTDVSILFQPDIRRNILSSVQKDDILAFTSLFGGVKDVSSLKKCHLEVNCGLSLIGHSVAMQSLVNSVFDESKSSDVTRFNDYTHLTEALFWHPSNNRDICPSSNAFSEVTDPLSGQPYLAVSLNYRLANTKCKWFETMQKRFPVNLDLHSRKVMISRKRSIEKTNKLLTRNNIAVGTERQKAKKFMSQWPTIFDGDKSPQQKYLSSMDTSCIFVGAGNYQSPAYFNRMLRSIRESGCACDVTIFTNNASNPTVRGIFEKYGAQWVEFYPLPDGVSEESMARDTWEVSANKPSWFRHLLFYGYFKLYCQDHQFVGWIDVRDVVFQGDPMRHLTQHDQLLTFTESSYFTLKHKKHIYLDWSVKTWGYSCPPHFEIIDKFPPINLGVVMGTRSAVLSALSLLICELKQCGGWDQFAFSRLVYSDLRGNNILLRASVRTLELGNVANLCSNLNVGVSPFNIVTNMDGVPYDIVHQYDRYDDLLGMYDAKFPFRDSTP
jgi:hypothetical protein